MDNIKHRKKERGIILVLTVVLTLIITIAIFVTSAIIINFISLTKGRETSSRLRYYAESGVYRSIWLLKNSQVIPPASVGPNDVIYNSNTAIPKENLIINSETVYMSIVYNANNDYTISATAGAKTVTAEYQDDKIIEW